MMGTQCQVVIRWFRVKTGIHNQSQESVTKKALVLTTIRRISMPGICKNHPESSQIFHGATHAAKRTNREFTGLLPPSRFRDMFDTGPDRKATPAGRLVTPGGRDTRTDDLLGPCFGRARLIQNGGTFQQSKSHVLLGQN